MAKGNWDQEECDRCKSKRLMSTFAKSSDLNQLFNHQTKEEYRGYTVEESGIGDGDDYIDFTYCMDCGKIQGTFPLPDFKFPGRDEEEEE